MPPGSACSSSASLPQSTTVAIIPARYESSRLPGKPLADIAGRPMIVHVLERARQACTVDRVIVATDDERVRSAVERFGGEAVMTRTDHPSGTDRLAEVAATLDGADQIVNVQGDEPLILPAAIDDAVRALLDDDTADMATACCPIADAAELHDPNVVKVVLDARGFALYFSRAPIPYPREGGFVAADRHLGLYVYRRACLLRLAGLPPSPLEQVERLEQLRALEHGLRIKVVRTIAAATGVDTPQDLERVRRLVAEGARA